MTTQTFLDFEKPVAELEGKIEELQHVSGQSELEIDDQVSKLRHECERQLRRIYTKLTPWQKLQVARHPQRPHMHDYIAGAFTDFKLLCGDRQFGEDPAIMGGLGRLRGHSVVAIGHEKGSDTESRVKHNFGMAKPEGYRKAQRLMTLAERYGLPVVTLIDTAGAYPGVAAENRGQSEAIASTIDRMLSLRVPCVVTIIGEGGSGGAIAIGAGDHIAMLEHSIYSVISPEGCASILWRSNTYTQEAAQALKLTAQDLKGYKVVDSIIEEPVGGAQRWPQETIKRWADHTDSILRGFDGIAGGELRARRRDKFLEMTRHLGD